MDPVNHRYLRPSDLRRLRHLALASPRPVEGRHTGRHDSRQRGRSIEFADYRPYLPGDQAADIDWKIYGRTDRLFIRLQQHQADLTLHLVVDASASMAYPHEPRVARFDERDSKYDHACRLAAALAFLACRRQDRVGLAVAQAGLHTHLPPRSSPAHLMQLLGCLDSTQPQGEAQLARTIDDLAERVDARGLVIVLSDLLDDPQAVLAAVGRFRARGFHLGFFHILHPHERDLPPLDQAEFIDSETGQRLAAVPDELREACRARFDDFQRSWAEGLGARRADYHPAIVGEDYLPLLRHYLQS
jgi:uncharacterized protein (DUF58 family)